MLPPTNCCAFSFTSAAETTRYSNTDIETTNMQCTIITPPNGVSHNMVEREMTGIATDSTDNTLQNISADEKPPHLLKALLVPLAMWYPILMVNPQLIKQKIELVICLPKEYPLIFLHPFLVTW